MIFKSKKILLSTTILSAVITTTGVAMLASIGQPWGDLSFWSAATKALIKLPGAVVSAAAQFKSDGLYFWILTSLAGLAVLPTVVTLAMVFKLGRMIKNAIPKSTAKNVTKTLVFAFRTLIKFISGATRAALRTLLSVSKSAVMRAKKWRAESKGDLKDIGSPLVSQARLNKGGALSPLDEWAILLQNAENIEQAKDLALKTWDETFPTEREVFKRKHFLGYLAIEKLEEWAAEARAQLPEDDDERAVSEVAKILLSNSDDDDDWNAPADFDDEILDEDILVEGIEGSEVPEATADAELEDFLITARDAYALLHDDKDWLSSNDSLRAAATNSGVAQGMALLTLSSLQRKIVTVGGNDFAWDIDESRFGSAFASWVQDNLDTLRSNAQSLAFKSTPDSEEITSFDVEETGAGGLPEIQASDVVEDIPEQEASGLVDLDMSSDFDVLSGAPESFDPDEDGLESWSLDTPVIGDEADGGTSSDDSKVEDLSDLANLDLSEDLGSDGEELDLAGMGAFGNITDIFGEDDVIQGEVEASISTPDAWTHLGDEEELRFDSDLVRSWMSELEVAAMGYAPVETGVSLKGGVASLRVEKLGSSNREVLVLLRYIPDGSWSIVNDTDGVYMSGPDAQRIGVSAELREAAKDALIIIHFHGPGSGEVVERNVDDLTFISTGVISGVKIEDLAEKN